MSQEKSMNRRQFLGSAAGAAAAAAAFTIVPRHVLGGGGQTPPSEKLNIAGIGVGGMGGANVHNSGAENIVALCDVDWDYAANMFKAYPKARQHKDFRRMLEEQKDIDAVIIGTPDHTHAVIAMAAIQAGKHVYCQKPLTHTIHEARVLTEAARKAGVTTQMGIQYHSAEETRLICEWIWAGAVGNVREVIAWSTLSYYPWGHASWSSSHGTRPKETPPVPPTLDWDLWLGPAPHRPYHRCYHPASWRAWVDFGVGMLGDRGVHTFDSIFWALKLGHPVSVEASNTNPVEETYPIASIVTYKFPARGEMPPVTMKWYDGLTPPRPEELDPGRQMGGSEGGILFRGDKGTLMCDYTGQAPRLIPESKMKEFQRPPKTLARVKGSHEEDWIRCCKEGKQPSANFDFSGPLTEMVLLGNVAKRVEGVLEWDGPNMMVKNKPDANQYVSSAYRSGWSL